MRHVLLDELDAEAAGDVVGIRPKGENGEKSGRGRGGGGGGWSTSERIVYKRKQIKEGEAHNALEPKGPVTAWPVNPADESALHQKPTGAAATLKYMLR